MKSIVLQLGALSVIAALAGCAPTEIVARSMGAEPHDQWGVLFVARTVESEAHPDALLLGVLTVDQAGCIRGGTEGHTMIWPRGYRFEGTAGGGAVLNAAGSQVAVLGEPARLGGGETAQLGHIALTRSDAAALTGRCPGKYWLVAP